MVQAVLVAQAVQVLLRAHPQVHRVLQVHRLDLLVLLPAPLARHPLRRGLRRGLRHLPVPQGLLQDPQELLPGPLHRLTVLLQVRPQVLLQVHPPRMVAHHQTEVHHLTGGLPAPKETVLQQSAIQDIREAVEIQRPGKVKLRPTDRVQREGMQTVCVPSLQKKLRRRCH